MTKVISLSNQAYDEMKGLKEEGESFSDVVLRLAARDRKRSILEFAGAWPGSREEAGRIAKEIAKQRASIKTREAKFG